MNNTEHLGGKYYGKTFSYEDDKIRKLFAYFLLFSSLIIFILTLSGVTDGISKLTTDFLKHNLGITNKWNKTYGPEWFVGLMKEFSALGGKVLLFISSILIVIYYKLKGKNILLWKFLFIFLGGNILLLLLKIIFIDEMPYEPTDFLIKNITHYPSGHAMISMIFYLTLAVLIIRKQRRKRVKRFIIISALILISVISMSRILINTHTVTEVIAGLSAGLVWLCLCWLAERFLKINYRWDI